MAIELVTCPTCYSKTVNLYGKTKQRKQRYKCKQCNRTFIMDYTYNGHKSSVIQYIIPLTLRGSGIRDIAYVLSISVNTVFKSIRRYYAHLPEPIPRPASLSVKNVEIDELWSFVRRKSRQRWLWYAYDRETKNILAYVVGRRTDRSCQQLLRKLSCYTIETFHTDNWESYRKYIDPARHCISKLGTQRIERTNLNFRTHLKRLQRRTICFSKSDEIHYAVLSLYIHAWNSS